MRESEELQKSINKYVLNKLDIHHLTIKKNLLTVHELCGFGEISSLRLELKVMYGYCRYAYIQICTNAHVYILKNTHTRLFLMSTLKDNFPILWNIFLST